jgi:general stress protein CsbA
MHKFYVINLDVVSLFADSSLLVFSEIEYVMISIDVFPMNLNEWTNIVVFESKKLQHKLKPI